MNIRADAPCQILVMELFSKIAILCKSHCVKSQVSGSDKDPSCDQRRKVRVMNQFFHICVIGGLIFLKISENVAIWVSIHFPFYTSGASCNL